MKLVTFYEKPGCATNRKQKKLLQEAGCTLLVHDLLNHGLTKEEISLYLQDKEVAAWFNPNAPKIKKGEIDPVSFSAEEALELLFQEPILIRRPLISIKGEKMCGFDSEKIESLLDISFTKVPSEACSGDSHTTCNPETSF